MANITVARSTYQAITGENVLVREIGDEIALLDRDTTPLLVMSINAKRKFGTKVSRVEKIEDDVRQLWGFHNASAIDSVNTQVLVNDGTLFAAGDLVAAQKAVSSAAAEEIIRVTGIATNTLTVTRGIGGAGADTIGASNALRIIGSAYAENAGLGTVRTTTKTTIISYTQIFREPFSISRTMRANETFGEREEEYQVMKAQIELKKAIEGAALWGRASESLSAPGSIRTTMGFKARVTTNLTDMGTTITLAKFNTLSETGFRYGNKVKTLIAAPVYHSAVANFGQGKMQVRTGETVFGVNFRRLVLPHGDLLMAPNYMMENGISGQGGYADEAYVVDLSAIELRYLNGNGVNCDVALYRNVKKDGTDGFTHEYLGELCWVIISEKKHARSYNGTAYS